MDSRHAALPNAAGLRVIAAPLAVYTHNPSPPELAPGGFSSPARARHFSGWRVNAKPPVRSQSGRHVRESNGLRTDDGHQRGLALSSNDAVLLRPAAVAVRCVAGAVNTGLRRPALAELARRARHARRVPS